MSRDTLAETLPTSPEEASDYKYAVDESCIVAIINPEGIINYANENFCKISRYSSEELIGRDYRIITSGDPQRKFIRELWNTVSNGKIWRGEFNATSKDGSVYWVDTTLVPFLNKEKKLYQCIAIGADITERKKLEEQQKLFTSIVNSSDDAILSKTLDGMVTSWNHSAEKVFGYTAEEIVGKSITMLIPGYLQNEETEIIKKISQGKFVKRFETERIRKDKKIIDVSISVSPVQDASGKIIGASNISRDITERKKVEKRIIKTRRMYAFLSRINQGIVHLRDEQELYYNACNIAVEIGLYRVAWIGIVDEKNLLQVVAVRGDADIVKELLQCSGKDFTAFPLRNSTPGEVLNTGKYVVKNDVQNDPAMQVFKETFKKHGIKATVSFPLKKFGKTIGVFGVHSLTENFFDEEEIELLVEAANDISFALENMEREKQRLHAEVLLKHSENILNEAQAIAQVGNWEIDLVNNTESWSDQLYRMYGVEKGFVKPTTELFLSFIHPDDAAYANEKVRESFATLENSSFEFRFIRRDGTLRYGATEARFEFDEKKKPLRLYGIVKDITSQKQRDEEREKMIQDMIQRTRDLEQFAFIVSHNLRAPTANIMGYTEYLRDESLTPEEQKEGLIGLSVSVSKLDAVIKDLNNILQVKRDINDKKELIRFSQIVNDIYISVGDLIKKQRVKIKTDFSQVDEIFSLKGYMHSIFYNLISNSIKYGKPEEPPLIEITSAGENNKTILTFKDNGLGIDLETKGDKVFGLYKRFHSHEEGKGMGLFMVKTQVESLGGKISVASELNKGTEFRIEFEN